MELYKHRLGRILDRFYTNQRHLETLFRLSETGSYSLNLSMPYLIDANNLAGKMNLLGENDFDWKLFLIVSRFANLKNKKIILVFDGYGNVADAGTTKVIYAKGDYGFNSADEKIIDMIRYAKSPEDYIVVSNDHGIVNEIHKFNEEKRLKIQIASASDFAGRVRAVLDGAAKDEPIDEDKLNKDEVDKINDELLKIWK
jgi:hypothetical protein